MLKKLQGTLVWAKKKVIISRSLHACLTLGEKRLQREPTREKIKKIKQTRRKRKALKEILYRQEKEERSEWTPTKKYIKKGEDKLKLCGLFEALQNTD